MNERLGGVGGREVGRGWGEEKLGEGVRDWKEVGTSVEVRD